MGEIWTMGELLVEIMRPRPDMNFAAKGSFSGPFPSGAPGIFIDTVARLGHEATIVSGIGDDDFGRCILDRFRRDGVRTDFIEVFPGRSTGVAFVAYFKDGSRKYIFHWDGTPAVMAQAPEPSSILDPKYFHVMGCSLMANDAFRERVFEAVEKFVLKGAAITFDPNIRYELLNGRSVDQIVEPIMKHCSILFPGEKELEILSKRKKLEDGIKEMFSRHPLKFIVLKRGNRGCTVFSRDSSITIPAFRIHEVDPTGAGDCFDAGFLCGLLDGKDVEQAALIASAVGALNAKAFGPMEGAIDRQSVANLVKKAKQFAS